MSEFTNRMVEAMQASILKLLTKGDWLTMDYADRIRLPAGELREVYALVDWSRLRGKIAERVESELADRLVNAIAAELATDIKQILSDKEQRERIRSLAREHIDRATRSPTQ